MDDGRERPSLADDPDFLGDLDLLDQALGGHPVRKAPAHSSPQTRPAPPPSASVPQPPPSRAAGRPVVEFFPPPPAAPVPPPEPSPPRRSPTGVGSAAASPPRRYETFYGLTEPPFAIEPDTRFLYHSTAHDQASRQLLDGLGRREGVFVLTGPPGIGKTMLCRAVLEQLDRRWLKSIVTAPVASFDDLVCRMLVDFGVQGQDRIVSRAREGAGERVSTLRAFLGSLVAPDAGAVLEIDDAHKLSAAVLVELQQLVGDAGPTLQVLIAGEPSILQTLDRAELRELRHRVAHPIALAPLAADELAGYVMHRIQVAGMGPRVEFDDESLAVLYHASGGTPRLVNLIADRALAIAFGSASSVVDAGIVETASADVGAIEPPSRGREFLEIVAIGVLFALLAGLGAGAAAWVFRDRVHEALIEWQAR